RTLHNEVFEWPRRGELDASAGTPAYVSPEQAAGERDLDARSDVFSLACVVYEMLTGRPPFDGTNTEAVVARRFVAQPPSIRQFAPDVPVAVEAVVERAMAIRRERRPASPDAFASDLAEAAALGSNALTSLAVTVTRAIGAARRWLGHRPAFGLPVFEISDVKFALRQARRAPAFTLAVVLTLALGIGATSAIFSVVNGVLLRPLPFAAPERLVRLWETSRQFSAQLPSAPNLSDWRQQNTVFTDIGAYADANFNIVGDGEPEHVSGAMVSPAFFGVLGVAPEIGRVVGPGEDVSGGERVVVVSDQLWRRRFGGANSVLGQRLDVNGVPATVIGVMPPTFRYPKRDTDVWAPLVIPPNMAASRGNHGYWTVARLKDGVTLAQARDEMRQIATRLAQEYPGPNEGHSARVEPMQETLVGRLKPGLIVLSGAVAFVLLIACTNVVSLLLSRALGRRRENAVRVALGVGQARLVRQYLTESVVLAVAGGAAGLLVARWGLSGLVVLAARLIPPATSVTLDARVTAFNFLVAALSGLACGVIPAWQATRVDPVDDLKQGRGAGDAPRRHRLRDALVVAQVASALVLLTGAGLLIRSFSRLQSLDSGIKTEGVLTMKLALPEAKYNTGEKVAGFYDRLLEHVSHLPGVTGTGVVTLMPLEEYGIGTQVTALGARDSGGPAPFAEIRAVSPDYFRTVGMTLLQGRLPDARDNSRAPGVAVVNQALADVLFPGQSAVGKRLGGLSSAGTEIVGVVSTARQISLLAKGSPELYSPVPQSAPFLTQSMTLMAKTSLDPLAITAGVRRAVLEVDPTQPVYDIRPLAAVVAQSVSDRRLNTVLLGTLAAVALALAAIGLYGLMSATVTYRMREIGVRLAIGGEPGDVMRLVVRKGLALTLSGLAIGMIAALALTRLMKTLLYDVKPTDPLTFIGVALVLVVVAVGACVLPARRAMRVDPVVVLRYE
ncbi:MAG TPA: ADOP family duplicated permease, partial [Gemmatimonadales bacterium]